jgi:hypothetical protein
MAFSTFRLGVATSLTFALVVAEITVGHYSRCLTLLVVSDQGKDFTILLEFCFLSII